MLLLSLMIGNHFVLTKVQNTRVTMFNQTFALIRNLSYQLPDQMRADRAMHQVLCSNIKLTRRVLTKNVIKTIASTNEVYELECQLCTGGQGSVYIGETARNLYSRSKEHLSLFRSGSPTSFIVKHQDSAHRGEEPAYQAKVIASTRDCLSRQVREAVLIRRSQKQVLNGKSEWHQPPLYRVQHEVEQG